MNSIISITDLKQNTAAVVNQAIADPQPITVTKKSDPAVIVVQHQYFQALEDAVMDLTDSLEAEKAKTESTISLDQYLSQRKFVHET